MYYFSHKPQTISVVIFAPLCHSHEIAPTKGAKSWLRRRGQLYLSPPVYIFAPLYRGGNISMGGAIGRETSRSFDDENRGSCYLPPYPRPLDGSKCRNRLLSTHPDTFP